MREPLQMAMLIISDMYSCRAYLRENPSENPSIELAKECALVVAEHYLNADRRLFQQENIINSEENVLVLTFGSQVEPPHLLPNYKYWKKVIYEINNINS